MDWYARSRNSGRPQRAALAGPAAIGDHSDRVPSPPPVPGITRSAVALTRVFAGQADQVRYARQFVKAALDEACPVADLVVLLAGELITNALIHARSGKGGLFEVIAWSGPSSVCVAVLDGGTEGEPSPADSDAMRECGRGLMLVDALATRWGHAGDSGGRVTWFVVRWPEDQQPGGPGCAG